MAEPNASRRDFLGTSLLGATAVAVMASPATAVAQALAVKPADLPDMTIKEVKVYNLGGGRGGRGPTTGAAARGGRQIASIVTNGGIEGNYTLNGRYWHPDWGTAGWLDFARRACVGRSALELMTITSQWEPEKRRRGQSPFASAIDNCLWDIMGKAANLPVYRLLGAHREKVLAYASSQHWDTVEEFAQEVLTVKSQGFKAYKIHPPSPGGGHDYKLDIEVLKACRKAGGDDFILLHDPVGVYTREEAIKVGRVCEELKYVAYEDPIPTTDVDGLVELCRDLTIPIHVGEFIFSIYDYPEYIRRGALDVVRIIVDNVGGITGGIKIARLAEAFGLECAPHNWGEIFDHAVHFHLELAMPNNVWFEMTVPQGRGDRPYMKDNFRVNPADGYVHAPTKPGLGYEIDRDVLDRMTVSIDR